MNINRQVSDTKPQDVKIVEGMISRWSGLLEVARRQLHMGDWQKAAQNYHNAQIQAEILLAVSKCKNCAIKGYVRTIVEYCFVLRKSNESHLLSKTALQARYALSVYATEVLTAKLLTPIHLIEHSTITECEIFINELFAGEAVNKHQIH